jgi:hypothetical protein
MTDLLVILIVSLAAAGLAWWMRKETGPDSSCGSSCSCCTKCDELMSKLSDKKTSADEKKD